jgi:hypothetical protein
MNIKNYCAVKKLHDGNDNIDHRHNSKKPKVNHKIFCPDIDRTKLQFKSEGSANLFIKFNGFKIGQESGKYPVRAYYCDKCFCWHVTSMAYAPRALLA